MPTLAEDAAEPEVGRDIPDIEGDDLRAPQRAEGHQCDKHALAHCDRRLQQLLDRGPPRHVGEPRLLARACERIRGIADELVAAHGPLAKAAQRGQADADRVRLEPAMRQVVLVAPTVLHREVAEQHRASHLLHDKRLEISETPPVGLDRAWGRLLLNPEIVTELLEQGGQAHRLPPRVRHALGGSIGWSDPGVKLRDRWGRRRDRIRSGRRGQGFSVLDGGEALSSWLWRGGLRPLLDGATLRRPNRSRPPQAASSVGPPGRVATATKRAQGTPREPRATRNPGQPSVHRAGGET